MVSLLEVTPSDKLKFTGPIDGVFTANMTLKNTSSKPVCFSQGFTNLLYEYSAFTGLIMPGDSKQIQVMMQQEITRNDIWHHGYIYSCVAPAGNIQDLDSIWKNVNQSEICSNKWTATFVLNTLKVTPSDDLVFTRSTSSCFDAYMTLKNTSSKSVYFEVRSPQDYIAYPNFDYIRKGGSKKITVKSIGEIIPAERHRIVVVKSSVVPDGGFKYVKSIWENLYPSEICINELTMTFIENKNPSSGEESKKIVDATVKDDVNVVAGNLDSLDVENIVLRQECSIFNVQNIRQELDDARRELVEARREIEDIRAAHSKEVKNIRKDLGAVRADGAEALRELNEARKELEESRASHSNEVTNIRQELETVRADGDAARQELNDARKEIEESRVAHSKNVKEIRQAKAALEAIRDITLNYEGAQGIGAAQTRFECEICLEEFTDVAGNCTPKVLRCGHTICSSCVNSLKQNNSVACPFCRVVTSKLAEICNNYIILGDNQ